MGGEGECSSHRLSGCPRTRVRRGGTVGVTIGARRGGATDQDHRSHDCGGEPPHVLPPPRRSPWRIRLGDAYLTPVAQYWFPNRCRGSPERNSLSASTPAPHHCPARPGTSALPQRMTSRSLVDDHRTRARDLPETALHATSHRPMPRPSTLSFTWAAMLSREVLHGDVNPRRIDGKDGVAGSRVLAFRLSTDVNDSGGEHLVSDLLRVEVGTPGWDSDDRPTELHQVAISGACLPLGPPSRIAVREGRRGDEGHVQPLGRF